MSGPTLQESLNTRLALQISLSSLPVVEEWMDADFDRWLESIPLPPELPSGEAAAFRVSLGSDLSRLTWGATGHPAGFIPKMSTYFQSLETSGEDIELINQVGGTFEPGNVGTWVTADAGAVATGWQFRNEFDLAAIQSLFGDHEGKSRLGDWAAAHNATRFRRFAQGVGERPFTEVEVIVPGETVDQQLDAVAAGFRELLDVDLCDGARRALGASRPELGLAVRIGRGEIARVAAVVPGPGLDGVSALCKDAGLGFDGSLSKIQGALSAELASFEYARTRAGESQVDVHLAVGAAGDMRKPGMN